MRPFVVCHDYETGGLWWWITANSAEQIMAMFRDVVVFEQPPPWWTGDLDRMAPRTSIDDHPDQALALLLR
jgi:hypothetical protein